MAYEANRKKETRLKHVRVYDQLYRLIQEGVFPAGSQLPSEPVLAGQLSVSRMTLRRALALLQEDHLVKNIRGKGNFICAPSSCTPPFETGKTRHPIYSCCAQPFGEVELEFRIEPPTEAITQSLGQKSAAVVIADRWYRQGDTVSAYSLSFIPIRGDCRAWAGLKPGAGIKNDFWKTSVYSGEYGSACALTYTTTGNFTAVKYVLSHDSAFILVQETIYGRERQILVSSKHYIPVELFEVHLVSGEV